MPLKSKTPVQPLPGIDSLDEVARRYFSQKKRASMDAEDFGNPDKKAFPVKNQEDLDNAARLVGHADNPDAVKSRLKTIAKRKGLSLPDSWQAEEASKAVAARATDPDDANPDGDGRDGMELFDDITAGEGSDVEDESEDADGDEDLQPEAVDGRAASSAGIERTVPAPDVLYYAPIARINKEKREVIGVATAEIKDAYRTVIGYEASKDAFQRWEGNIREMHQSKAVGRALKIIPDDEHKRIIVRARISKGAQDTWEKILDGTLRGFSIGGRNGKWTTRVVDGEELPYLERYDQAELSVVDNPGCPVANFEIVRADGMATNILATEQEMSQPTKPEPTAPPVERKSVQISAANREKIHASRDALTSMCADAGCPDCMAAMNKAAENDDNDGDMDTPASQRKLIADIVRSTIAEALRDQVAPMVSRVNALLTYDAQRSDESPEITRRVDGIDDQLSAIKELVEKIAAQPVDGGPVLHGGGGPVDKRLATQGAQRGMDDPEIMRRAMEMGFAPPTDPQEQIKAAAKLFRPIPR